MSQENIDRFYTDCEHIQQSHYFMPVIGCATQAMIPVIYRATIAMIPSHCSGHTSNDIKCLLQWYQLFIEQQKQWYQVIARATIARIPSHLFGPHKPWYQVIARATIAMIPSHCSGQPQAMIPSHCLCHASNDTKSLLMPRKQSTFVLCAICPEMNIFLFAVAFTVTFNIE